MKRQFTDSFSEHLIASRKLADYLRTNVGTNADFPIRIKADNTADAEELAGLLMVFESTLKRVEKDQK